MQFQAQVDVYNSRDAEAFAARYDENATVIGPDGTVMMSRRDGISSVHREPFTQSPDCTPRSAFVSMPTTGWSSKTTSVASTSKACPRPMRVPVVYHVADGGIDRSQTKRGRSSTLRCLQGDRPGAEVPVTVDDAQARRPRLHPRGEIGRLGRAD